MEWYLLVVGMLSILGTALAIKAYLKLKRLEERNSDANTVPITGSGADLTNVLPFPQSREQSRVHGISDDLWKRWVKISTMDHSKERADLLLELMNDTVKHVHEHDRRDD